MSFTPSSQKTCGIWWLRCVVKNLRASPPPSVPVCVMVPNLLGPPPSSLKLAPFPFTTHGAIGFQVFQVRFLQKMFLPQIGSKNSMKKHVKIPPLNTQVGWISWSWVTPAHAENIASGCAVRCFSFDWKHDYKLRPLTIPIWKVIYTGPKFHLSLVRAQRDVQIQSPNNHGRDLPTPIGSMYGKFPYICHTWIL